MKIMKKILVIVGLVAISALSFGQKKATVTYGVGAQSLIQTSSSEYPNAVSNGAYVQVECQTSKNVSYTLSVGANEFLTKTSKDRLENISTLGGVKYHLNDKVALGVAAGVLSNTGDKPWFIYSPALTLQSKLFNVDLKYLGTLHLLGDNKLSQVGIGVTYKL